jgi:hypothetical protein
MESGAMSAATVGRWTATDFSADDTDHWGRALTAGAVYVEMTDRLGTAIVAGPFADDVAADAWIARYNAQACN